MVMQRPQSAEGGHPVTKGSLHKCCCYQRMMTSKHSCLFGCDSAVSNCTRDRVPLGPQRLGFIYDHRFPPSYTDGHQSTSALPSTSRRTTTRSISVRHWEEEHIMDAKKKHKAPFGRPLACASLLCHRDHTLNFFWLSALTTMQYYVLVRLPVFTCQYRQCGCSGCL